jgi:hypothetical protein
MVRELQQQTSLIDYTSVDYTTQAINIYTAEKSILCIRFEFIFCELVFNATFSSFVFPLCYDLVIIQFLNLVHRRGYSMLVQLFSSRTPVGVLVQPYNYFVLQVTTLRV